MRAIMTAPPNYPSENLALLLSHSGIVAQVKPFRDFTSCLYRDPDAAGILLTRKFYPASLVTEIRMAQVKNLIIVMSRCSEFAEARAKILRAGADDAQPITLDPSELVSRLRALYRRRIEATRVDFDFQGCVYTPDLHRIVGTGGMTNLTVTEGHLLTLLCMRRGSLVTKSSMLETLYGLRNDLPEERIIDVYLHKIRKKIRDAGGNHHLIQTVWGQGFRFENHLEGVQ